MVKALVIDDSRMIRKAIEQILKPMGFEIVQAENGREGLEKLRAMGKPDVILVDWNMPEMDGLEFVKAVRSDSELSSLCVVMVTTQSEMDQVTQAIDAGVTEYVMKPFTPEVIHDKLAMVGIPV